MSEQKSQPTPAHSERRSRPKRFVLGQPVYVFMRAMGSRAYLFEMRVINISRSGLLLVSKHDPVIPFNVGTKLAITLDVSCKIFSHPIVTMGRIVRRIDASEVEMGIELTSIEKSHRKTFDQGLNQIGDKDTDEY